MRSLNEKQQKKLAVLKRKQRVLEDNKKSILNTLNPVLEDLDKIRIAIDEIEIENKYGNL
jgi:hypothetical protein